jgi:hypothetical protein
MDDRVGAIRERPLEHGRICNVALGQIDCGIWMRIEIDYPDPGALARELGHGVAPDEAGAAGDQDPAPAKPSPARAYVPLGVKPHFFGPRASRPAARSAHFNGVS